MPSASSTREALAAETRFGPVPPTAVAAAPEVGLLQEREHRQDQGGGAIHGSVLDVAGQVAGQMHVMELVSQATYQPDPGTGETGGH
jgi:hypothetical protein